MSAPPEHAVRLDDSHYIEFVYYRGQPAGINEWHKKSGGEWCRGWCAFHGSPWACGFTDPVGWDVVQLEPLTLTPSLKCRICGSHGHITDGKWVPA